MSGYVIVSDNVQLHRTGSDYVMRFDNTLDSKLSITKYDKNTTTSVTLATIDENVLDVNNKVISGVNTPLQATDAANRGYVDRTQKIFQDINYALLSGNTYKIVAYGDEITYGSNGLGSQYSVPYPLLLQTLMNYYYNGSNLTVTNRGVIGYTSASLITNFGSNVISESPDCVIQMIGLTDCKQGVTLDTFRTNLMTLAELYITNGIPVIYSTTTPIYKFTSTTSTIPSVGTALASYNQVIRDVANMYNIPLIDTYSFLNHILDNSNEIDIGNFLTDNYYIPTSEGTRVLGCVIYTCIVPTIIVDDSNTELSALDSYSNCYPLGYPPVTSHTQSSYFSKSITFNQIESPCILNMFFFVINTKTKVNLDYTTTSNGDPGYNVAINVTNNISIDTYTSVAVDDNFLDITPYMKVGINFVRFTNVGMATNKDFTLLGLIFGDSFIASDTTNNFQIVNKLGRLTSSNVFSDTDGIRIDIPSSVDTITIPFTSKYNDTSCYQTLDLNAGKIISTNLLINDGTSDKLLVTNNFTEMSVNNRIIGDVNDPVANKDAANKQYVDRLQTLFTSINQQCSLGGNYKIVAFGDSITFGYNPSSPGAQLPIPYPLELQNLLRYFYGNSNIVVANQGVSGNTTNNLISRFQTSIVDQSPDCVIQMIGINDCGTNVNIDTFRDNLVTLFNLYAANDIPVIYATPTPVKRNDNSGFTTSVQYRLNFYADATRSVCKQFGIPLIDINIDFDVLLNSYQGYNINNFLPVDTYHPIQSGYKLIAQMFFKSIVPTVIVDQDMYQYMICGGDRSYLPSGNVDVYNDALDPYLSNYILRGNAPTTKILIPVFFLRNVKTYEVNFQNPLNSGGEDFNYYINQVISTNKLKSYDTQSRWSYVSEIAKDDFSSDVGLYIFEFRGSSLTSGKNGYICSLLATRTNRVIVTSNSVPITVTKISSTLNENKGCYVAASADATGRVRDYIIASDDNEAGVKIDFNASTLRPIDGVTLFDLGTSSNRYNNLYLTNNVNISSDSRLKLEVQRSDIHDELATRLRGLLKLYRMKNGNRKIRFGTFAQDILGVFETLGLNYEDYNIVERDVTGMYSVNYIELLCLVTLS